MLEGEGVRPRRGDGARRPIGPNACLCGSVPVGRSEIKQDVEPVPACVFNKGAGHGFKGARIGVHGQALPTRRGFGGFADGQRSGDMEATASEKETTRVHATQHGAEGVEEASDDFLGGGPVASTDIDGGQPTARVFEMKALSATVLTFHGFDLKPVEVPKRLW